MDNQAISRELERHLRPYAERLQLEWQINYLKHPESGFAARSNSAERSHELYYDHGYVARALSNSSLGQFTPSNPEALGSLIHELCHLYLGEKVDVAFSGRRLSKKHDDDGKDLDRKLGIFQLLDAPTIDMWVNDILFKNWPDIADARMAKYLENYKEYALAGAPEVLLTTTIFFKLAQVQADRNRHGMKNIDFSGILDPLRTSYPLQYDALGRFRGHLEKLPTLPSKKDEALTLYQSSVNDSMKVMGVADVKARLIEEDGVQVWAFD